MKHDKISIGILRKMYNYNFIGKKHTSIDDLPKSFPKHERGDVKKTVKKLIKDGLVLPKPTGYGQHCSLNHNRIDEIEELIGDGD